VRYEVRILATAALAAVAATAPGRGEGAPVAMDEAVLIGSWSKQPGERCGEIYPPQVEFRARGVYFAPEGPNLGSIWHGGGWRLEGNATLVVEAANDANLRYRLVAEPDAITLTDERGCEVRFRRD